MALIPRTRTRAAAPETTPTPEASAPRSRIQRHAAPAPTPAPRTRVRTDRSAPVPVHGLAKGFVEVSHATSGVIDSHMIEHVEFNRRMPDGTFECARIAVGGGVTISPVQYESVRIEVRLELPVFPSPEEYQKGYEECAAFVERTIREQTNLATGG
jgi:hypothetical protein